MDNRRTTTAARWRGVTTITALVLATIILGVYSSAREGSFVWDDHATVERNRALRTTQPLHFLFEPFWLTDPMSDAKATYYRPLTNFSFHLDIVMKGEEPQGLHQTSVALHTLAVLLFAAVARRLGATVLGSFLAALVWGLLPRLTESVAWISGRSDILAAIGAFAAMSVWPYWPSRAQAPHEPRQSWAKYLDAAAAPFACAFFLLGLLAKEVAIAGVLATAVGTWLGSTKTLRNRRTALLGLPLLGYFVLRSVGMAKAPPARATIPFGERVPMVFEALFRYLEMSLDPWHPASSIGVAGVVDPWRTGGGIVIAIAVIAGSVFALRRIHQRHQAAKANLPLSESAGIVVGLVFAVTAIAPVLHVIPLNLSGSVAADHLLYLPLAGVALSLSVVARVVARRLPRRLGLIAMGVTGVLAVSFVPVTVRRTNVYDDELSFWLDATERSTSGATVPRALLANLVRDFGDPALACQIHARSRKDLERLGRTNTSRYARATENLAGCVVLLGRFDEAKGLYLELLKEKPDNARVQMELGYAYLHLLDLDAAERAMQAALVADPTLTSARVVLSELPAIRADLTRFRDPEARAADLAGWARFMAQAGREPDAERAWSVLGLDPATSIPDLTEAAAFLVNHGDVPMARRVLGALMVRGGDSDHLLERLKKRENKRSRLAAARQRIQALL